MADFNDYHNFVDKSLLSFQFIEELIRMYLEKSYWIIQKKVGKDLTITLSRKNIEKLSLGGLLREFEKFNGDDSLKKGIRKLIPWRNICAHRALLFSPSDFANAGEDELRQIEIMRKVSLATKGCVTQLIQENEKLEAIKKKLDREEGKHTTSD